GRRGLQSPAHGRGLLSLVSPGTRKVALGFSADHANPSDGGFGPSCWPGDLFFPACSRGRRRRAQSPLGPVGCLPSPGPFCVLSRTEKWTEGVGLARPPHPLCTNSSSAFLSRPPIPNRSGVRACGQNATPSAAPVRSTRARKVGVATPSCSPRRA